MAPVKTAIKCEFYFQKIMQLKSKINYAEYYTFCWKKRKLESLALSIVKTYLISILKPQYTVLFFLPLQVEGEPCKLSPFSARNSCSTVCLQINLLGK